MKGSGVVFTHGEGVSTPHVRHKGRQPLIECANMTLIFMFPFMSLYPLYPFYIFSFLWSTRVFPFAPTYSSIMMGKSDLRSSCFMRESSDSFLLKGDHFKALDLENDPFYLVRN